VGLVIDPTRWVTGMPRFRISLASMLGIVAVMAMGLAGIVSASTLWTTVAATVTLALLLSAAIAARLLDGLERAFWAGFALFGWTYLLLVNWDWVGGPFGHDLTAGLSDVAEVMFAEVTVTAPPQPPPMPALGQTPPSASPNSNRPLVNPVPTPVTPVLSNSQYLELVRARQIKLGNFVQIGRMFLALLFGLLGGVIARTIAQARVDPAAAREPPSRATTAPSPGSSGS
jgi:hypothetical protein